MSELSNNTKSQDLLWKKGIEADKLGRFSEAIHFFKLFLKNASNSSIGYYRLGMAYHSNKELDKAIGCYDRSISLDAKFADAHCDKGVALAELGKRSDAIQSYDHAIQIDPEYAEAFYNRGVSLLALEANDAAINSFLRALQLNSNFVMAELNLGVALTNLEKYEDALKIYESLIKKSPQFFAAFLNRGAVLNKIKRFDEALKSYDKAISIKSDYAEAFNERGLVLHELKRFDEALNSFEKAISIKSDYAEAFYNRGNMLADLKRFDEALKSYDKAISIKSDYAEAFSNRGNTLCELKRFDDALMSYDKAITFKSDYAEAFYTRGNTLSELKRFDDALMSYDKAIALKSDYAEARYAKAFNLLQKGNFSEGWLDYEYRFKIPDFVRDSLEISERILSKVTPVMSVTDLIGKHLILIGEQGIGDVVMFASIAKDTLSFVTRLDFIVDKRLVKIFETSFSFSCVFSYANYHENDIPKDAIFMFIGSLAHLFRSKDAYFTKIPYLTPDPEKVANWRIRLQDKNRKLIGISWKGGTSNTRNWARSFPLQTFLTFLPDRDVRLVNVQYKSSTQEVREAANKEGLEILSFPESDTTDISDLSALLCALDHVVTVQNSNIHLCGALGVQCVGIIPPVPEWRYGLHRDEMVWYDSVRLLRIKQDMDLQNIKPIISSYLSQKVEYK